MNHEIIDNFLPEEQFAQLLGYMTSSAFSWYYSDTTAMAGSNEDLPYFAHVFFDNFVVSSNAYPSLFPVIERLDAKALIRAKGNLYPRAPSVVQDDTHVDFPFTHKGAILYMNTNNGPTVLGDGTKVDAVANRLLKFDASIPHCSSRCSDQKIRLNINFNYF